MSFCDHPHCSTPRIKALTGAHSFLCKKSRHYHAWHHNPHHKEVHLGTLLIVTVTAIGLLLSNFILPHQGKAADRSYTLTSKQDWDSGTNTNIDTENVPGEMSVASDGTWLARTWKTPPDTLSLGMAFAIDGTDIYTLRGNGDNLFWKYSISNNNWTSLRSTPFNAYQGANLEKGPADTLYATFGNYTKKFYKYTISTDTWTELAETPDSIGQGAVMRYAGSAVYLIRGNGSLDFWKYDSLENSWVPMTGPPSTVSYGSAMTYDGSNYLYLARGASTTWYRYSISGNSWATMTTITPNARDDAGVMMVYYNGAIYYPNGRGTNLFYKCVISDLACSGNAWNSLANLPLVSNYTGIIYSQSDGYMYIFRSNGTSDFWKYDIANDTFVGPSSPPGSFGAGSDMVWDGATGVYAIRNSSTSAPLYHYNINTNVWTTKTGPGVAVQNDSKSLIKIGNYLYLLQANGNTAFYRYDTTNDAGGWGALTAAPANMDSGASLVYPGSGDYIYAMRGTNTLSFWAYSIANNNWSTFDPADLPAGIPYPGGRLMTDGTNVFAFIGNGNTNFYKYTYAAGGGSWEKLGRLPFAPRYGTDCTYYSGKFYCTAGFYKNKFYEYTIATNSWRKLPNLQTSTMLDVGTYSGASVEYIGNNTIMVARGNGTDQMFMYTIPAASYLSSATFTSAAIDLNQVTSFGTLTTTQTVPEGASIGIKTQSSADGVTWEELRDLSGGNVQSSANRYLRVQAILTPTADLSQTPLLSSIQINYTSDETIPTNPTSFSGQSQQTDGVAITSGESYSYSHPYFSWSGASDAAGIDGYYVYFGTDSNADPANPATGGIYQAVPNFIVNTAMSQATYYLRIKTKDRGNKVSEATTGFTYTYNGVALASAVTKTLTADFNSGTLSNLDSAGDKLKLTGKAGFWREDRLSNVPVVTSNVGIGASIVYKPAVGKLYVAQGNSTASFWEYAIATDTWAVKSSIGTVINSGGRIVNGPGSYIYAICGNGSKTYRYDISNDAAGWIDADADDTPLAFGLGGYAIFDGARYIYAFRGSGDDSFYRFDTQGASGSQWSNIANANFGAPNQSPNNSIANGSSLSYDGVDTIYATQGYGYSGGFAKYSIAQNSWTPLSLMPFSSGDTPNQNGGSASAWDSTTNSLYFIPGNNLVWMYKYTPGTATWTKVSQAPGTFSSGAFIQPIDGIFYVLRGNNTSSFYKYNVAKDYWYTPNLGILGPVWYGTTNSPAGSGGNMVKGDGNNYYLIRGSYDDVFTRYNAATGTTTRMANLPEGAYGGSMLVYESTHNVIYAMIGDPERVLFKYNIASDTWSEETLDVPPIQSGSGGSMVYDGSRYIYFIRGGNSTNWYRYDTTADAGSRWSGALPITNLSNLSGGAELVYKDGILYTLRGGNNNPNNFYSFNTADLPGGSWTALTSLNTAVSNDGFLIDGNDGYLYAAKGNNTNEWWRYNIATPGWTQIANIPAQITNGGAGAFNGSNRVYMMTGSGTNSWSDAIYTYTLQTADSSFQESGSYTSESLDLNKVYNWANLHVDYADAVGTNIVVETRSSADNATWGGWTATSNEKVTGASDSSHEYTINSNPNRYLQVRFSVTSGDGVLSPTINDYSVNYYIDNANPTNPTTLSSAKSQVSNGTDITTNYWYNYPLPAFAWPAAGSPNGAADNAGGSGVAGYYLYYGTSSGATPSTTRGIATELGGTGVHFQATNSFTIGTDSAAMVDGNTYYLIMQTKDNAGNLADPVQLFKYKYDATVPSNSPSYVYVSPSGFTNTNSYTFSWPSTAITDPGYTSNPDTSQGSGFKEYQYKTGDCSTDSGWTNNGANLQIHIDNAAYQQDANTFCLRVVDNANNKRSPITATFYYAGSPPTAPQALISRYKLSGDSEQNDCSDYRESSALSPAPENNFCFSWSPPPEGSLNGDVKYYHYSLNVLPTANNTTSLVATAYPELTLDSYATIQGKNTIYIVAEDESGPANVDYNNYAQADFFIETSAPDKPTNVSVTDSSNRAVGDYRLSITWTAPENSEDIEKYLVFRATDGFNFSQMGETRSTGYIDSGLSTDFTYQYKIYAEDNAGSLSDDPVGSDVPSKRPTGKYITPPSIDSGSVVVQAAATSATITWKTDRDSEGYVEYGPTGSFGTRVVESGEANTSHQIKLQNLTPGAKYYFQVLSRDPNGLNDYEGFGTYRDDQRTVFTTTASTAIESVSFSQVTTNSAIMTFNTSKPSSSLIEFGPTTDYGGQINTDSQNLGSTHTIVFDNLSDGIKYQVKITITDAEGTTISSMGHSFETKAKPKIDGIKFESLTNEPTTSIKVTWKTNVQASSAVEYLSDRGDKKEVASSLFVTDHELEIHNLEDQSIYKIQAISRDQFGNEVRSDINTFDTPVDTRPPKITNLTTEIKSTGYGSSQKAQIVVTWQTDEPGTSQIEYAQGIEGEDYSFSTKEDTAISTSHAVIVTELEPSKIYHLRAVSRDGSGNTGYSEDTTTITGKSQSSVIDIIISSLTRSLGWMFNIFETSK